MCKNDVFVAKICNCKIRCFLSRKFANARSALALREIWRSPLARQLIVAWSQRWWWWWRWQWLGHSWERCRWWCRWQPGVTAGVDNALHQDDRNTEGFRTSVYTSHRSGVWNVFLLLLVCIRQTAKSSPLLLLCIVLSDIQTIRQTD